MSYQVAKGAERVTNFHKWARSIDERLRAMRTGKLYNGAAPKPIILKEWETGEIITCRGIMIETNIQVQGQQWIDDGQLTRWEPLSDFVEVGGPEHGSVSEGAEHAAHVPEELVVLLAKADAGDQDAIKHLRERYKLDEAPLPPPAPLPVIDLMGVYEVPKEEQAKARPKAVEAKPFKSAKAPNVVDVPEPAKSASTKQSTWMDEP